MAATDDDGFQFQLLSDIHVEITLVSDRFEKFLITGEYDVLSLPAERRLQCLAPTMVLLGDICTVSTLDRFDSLCGCLKTLGFTRIVYVPGNHEYYSSTVAAADIDGVLRTRCAALSASLGVEIVFLNMQTYDPPDGAGYRLAGCVLWSAPPGEARQAVEKAVSNIRYITLEPARDGRGRVAVTSEAMDSWHRQHAAWLAGEIARAKSDGKKLLVLTHYKPTRAWPARHRISGKLAARAYDSKNLIAWGFQADCDALLDPDTVKAWCYGHDHASVPQLDAAGRPLFVVNRVPLFSNQVGYISKGEEYEMFGGLNEGFNGRFVWTSRLELD